MTDKNELKENEKEVTKEAAGEETPFSQPIEKVEPSEEEESDLEQQRKEALTERD